VLFGIICFIIFKASNQQTNTSYLLTPTFAGLKEEQEIFKSQIYSLDLVKLTKSSHSDCCWPYLLQINIF
jgi:hypothetical protein